MAKHTKRSRTSDRNVTVQNANRDQEVKLEYEQNKVRFGPFKPRTEKQARLYSSFDHNRLTFIVGPAGTSKTFCSTSWAAEQLQDESIERIVITRPMVGCGEDMGFLPGDEMEKFSAWLDPFMDVLQGKLGKKQVATFMKYEKIVAKPLMFMRGSTFRNAVIILDEAQNTTEEQMKMFLTRIGENSKVIINGDLEQSDLPKGMRNGLADAVSIFKNSKITNYFEFDENDVVRDSLVREIVKGYRTKYREQQLRVA